MVEETSAAARNLSAEVTSLAERASEFTISNETRGSTTGAKLGTSGPIGFTPARSASAGYVSRVKALAAGALSNGAAAEQDWVSF